jgi:hypothetical protein
VSHDIDLIKLALCVQNNDLRYQILEHIAENLEMKAEILRNAIALGNMRGLEQMAPALADHASTLEESVTGIVSDNEAINKLHDVIEEKVKDTAWTEKLVARLKEEAAELYEDDDDDDDF